MSQWNPDNQGRGTGEGKVERENKRPREPGRDTADKVNKTLDDKKKK